jgi:hypothetical protein
MKKIFAFLLLAAGMFTAHAQNWLTAGNTLGKTGTFGSIDNKKINFISNNKNRGVLTSDGLWGFGTTSPIAQVHINSSDNTRNVLQADVLDSAKMIVSSNGGVSIGNANIPPINGLYVSGKLGIGINTPDVKLHIVGGNEVTLAGGGAIVAGQITDNNLAMDNNDIQARNNGAANTLHINAGGGDVNIGNGGLYFRSSPLRSVGIGTTFPNSSLQVAAGVHLSKTSDLGYFLLGSTDGNNIVMDDNQIQARNGASGISTLYLNPFGGDVNIRNLNTGGSIVAGSTGSENVLINATGIEARNGARAEILNLNPNGERTIIGGILQVNGNITMAGGGAFVGGGFAITRSSGDFIPDIDAFYLLGNSSKRWAEVWADDGSINTSDARDKKNIRDLNYGLKEIMQLHPVKFDWKDEHNTDDKLGLIAQDLQKVLPEVVKAYEYKRDSTGKRKRVPAERLGVMYSDIIPVIIKGMQQQQQIIEDQNKKIKALTQLVSDLASGNQIKNTQSESNEKSVAVLSDASLEQNAPNPFNQTTVIKYYLPSNAGNASISITDMNGKIVKNIPVTTKGSGQLALQAEMLTSGTYNYSLIINGRSLYTKKMIMIQ